METLFRSEISFPGFKETYSTSSLDSGCSDSFQTSRFKADETKEHKQKPVAEHQTFLEESTENLAKCSPVYSSRTRNEFQRSPLCCPEQDKKEKNVSSGFYETPRPSKKDASLQRRLLMSKAATEGSKDHLRTSVASRLSFNFSSFEESGSNEVIEFPEIEHFEALATSTLKTEKPVSSGRKKRFLFSQMRTSTLEEPKSAANQPLVPECITPVQFGIQNDLDESIISCFTHECLSQELLITPQSNKFSKPIQDKFITPVSNLAAKFQLNLSVLSTPLVTPLVKLDTSIPEDSGFKSLGLDKSEDSILDYVSFEELVPHKCKETPKVLEAKRRSWLERLRRPSTLKEGGSQAGEGVDSNTSVIKDLKSLGKVKKEPVAEEDDELFNETIPCNRSVLRLEDLTRTPALQAVHAMCLRSARKVPRHTAVEDLLGLSEGSKPFETTMPLGGLIGRNMGLRELDFLAELKHRNLRHVLALILNCLSPEDIYRFGQVSEVWNEIVLQDKMKNRIRRSYMKQLKAVAEQGSQTLIPDAETRPKLLSRSALRSVQSRATLLGTPTSGSNGLPFRPTGGSNGKQLASKHDEYLKVAKTLFNDESLWPCPRCQCPARCHPVKKQGICSREECAFDFCTYCFCTFHGSKECRSPSTKRRTENEMLPGSAKSKRNLKRL
ncbi:F-box only protein 43-like [Polyodon spathula]|uniref:F-box only protein 43-like n=1 Tax=Polyodon spathula TaxID=7913 RepID=UPI001B7F2941|nr:F-box only protein 43-like [Polyodon spathula]